MVWGLSWRYNILLGPKFDIPPPLVRKKMRRMHAWCWSLVHLPGNSRFFRKPTHRWSATVRRSPGPWWATTKSWPSKNPWAAWSWSCLGGDGDMMFGVKPDCVMIGQCLGWFNGPKIEIKRTKIWLNDIIKRIDVEDYIAPCWWLNDFGCQHSICLCFVYTIWRMIWQQRQVEQDGHAPKKMVGASTGAAVKVEDFFSSGAWEWAQKDQSNVQNSLNIIFCPVLLRVISNFRMYLKRSLYHIVSL